MLRANQNGFEGEYQAQELTVAEDGALTFVFVVTDGAIDSLTFQLVALPTNGKLYSGAGAAELAGQPVYHPITDSFLRYEPHPDFVGEDKLVYKVADPIGNGTLAEACGPPSRLGGALLDLFTPSGKQMKKEGTDTSLKDLDVSPARGSPLGSRPQAISWPLARATATALCSRSPAPG